MNQTRNPRLSDIKTPRSQGGGGASSVDVSPPQDFDRNVTATGMTRTLGFLSSHPFAEGRRALLWYMLAIAPLVVGLLVAWWLLLANQDDAVKWLAENRQSLLLYGISAGGFAAGLGLTAGLSARAARNGALVADAANPPIGFMLFLMGLIAIGALPWVLSEFFESPVWWAVLVVVGVLPIVVLVGVISLVPPDGPNCEPNVRPIRWWTLVFPLLVIVGAVVLRLLYAETIEALPAVQGIVKLLTESEPDKSGNWTVAGGESAKRWICHAIFAVAAAPLICITMLLVAWICDIFHPQSSFRLRRRRESAETRARGAGKPLGEDRWGVSVPVRSLPKKGEQTPDNKPPDWIGKLKAQVDPQEEWGDWQPTRYAPSEMSASYNKDSRLADFFGGIEPSEDQARAFIKVRQRHADLVSSGEAVPVSQDVLIEGDAGSGRTATLAASIIDTVVTRGCLALVLVPSEHKRCAMVRRLRRCAVHNCLGWYLNIDDLSVQDTRYWTEPQRPYRGSFEAPESKASAGVEVSRSLSEKIEAQSSQKQADAHKRSQWAPGQSPDVLVGTLADFERTFFSSAVNHERLRVVLHRIGLVAIDDLDLFDVGQRFHLPFTLDKLRLILASEGMEVQVVGVTPRMPDVGRHYLAERLFTSRETIDPAIIRAFRLPHDVGEPWQIVLRACEPGPRGVYEVIKRCARACLGASIGVIVFAPNMSTVERRKLKAELEVTTAMSAQVVSDLDDLADEDCADLGAVFHAATSSQGASMAIRARALQGDRCDGSTVVFTVVPKGVTTVEEPCQRPMIVVPDVASRSLFALHLKSAARFLKRLSPIDRDRWSRLGLPRVGELSHFQVISDGSDGYVRDDERVMLIDPPDSHRTTDYPREVRPTVTLNVNALGSTDPAAPHPVDIHGLLWSGERFASTIGGERVVPESPGRHASARDAERERRVAEWVAASDGQSLALTDLAYVSRLALKHGESLFVPGRISQPDGDDGQRIRVDAELWRDIESQTSPHQLVLQQLEQLAFPDIYGIEMSTQSARSRSVRLAGASPDPVRVKAHRTAQVESGQHAQTDQIGLTATFVMEGLGNSAGEVIRNQLRISYEASAFFALFGFSQDELENGALERTLLGSWSRSGNHACQLVPEIGLAMSYALRRQAPGLECLTRCIGFQVTSNAAERFGVLFVEPSSTHRSAQRVVEWIVGDATMLRDVTASMTQALQDFSGGAVGSEAKLLERGECCFGASLGADGTLQLDPLRAAKFARHVQSLMGMEV